jgi:hypothetical protein
VPLLAKLGTEYNAPPRDDIDHQLPNLEGHPYAVYLLHYYGTWGNVLMVHQPNNTTTLTLRMYMLMLFMLPNYHNKSTLRVILIQ